jgi:2-polyprenyl-3-methyl-5-hydroxy-6-metoxy-1,4-benzoquinol methylase
VLCANCGVAIRIDGTLASPDKRKEVYNPNWVEEHSRNRTAQDIADSVASTLAGVVDKDSRPRVLDIGCGSGTLVDKLARTGYDSFGIDWSESAIDFAKKHRQGIFVHRDVETAFDVGALLFDIVVASHILEHLEHPYAFLRSVSKVLKPQGFLCIAVPNLWWFDPHVPWRAVSTIFDPEHVIGYSPRGLHAVVTKAGFRTINMTTVTRPQALLTAMGVATYARMFGTKGGSGFPAENSHENGIPQRLYSWLSSRSLFRGVTYPILHPLAKRTEQEWALRGMELIVVAGKEQ